MLWVGAGRRAVRVLRAVTSARVRLWSAPAGLLIAAAAIRLSTLGLQSFWYDEAFTPVHVLRVGFANTLHGIVNTENSPPVWYVLAWLWSRLFGTGAVALRSISAAAGVGTVAVGWALGRELGGRRAAIVLAGLLAVNPLFVWYSQEARAYGLLVFTSASSLWLFVRADREPTPRRLGAWALVGALSLATHYFAVFLIVPQAVLLLGRRGRNRAGVLAVGLVGAVGLGLVPLILAQGAHGTQWIGRWALSSRLGAIPQYYLTGASGAPLGHGIELALFMPVAGLAALGARLGSVERRKALLMAGIGAFAIVVPIALALLGADYLAPRNLVAAWVAVSAALAVSAASSRAGLAGAAVLAAGWLAVVVAVDVRPRLQRGDWSGVAGVLDRGAGVARAVVTPQLGAAPLEYYVPSLHHLARGRAVMVGEVDLVGYRPLTSYAVRPPAPGFGLVERRWVSGLLVYRFRAASPAALSESRLRGQAISRARPQVLVGTH
jgi:mannosyltransferase